ncbi:MAG: ABC transporter ATP-binding protein [Candidatus Moranbacteria bacterium]|nr:ABC transporter ATP-binding protein [Candidatus Moranbacteria bacterium]
MSIINIQNVTKTFPEGTKALDNVSLSINDGEVFALLGPNGAGKTTLIGVIAGVVQKTDGTITVLGKDTVKDYRQTRGTIGLVPQEIQVDIFLSIKKTLEYQRGFFGKRKNEKLIEKTLKALSLWDKKDAPVGSLSGGMKRRVLIAKALMNEPKILFLDEPTAGVDVELRKGMWDYVKELKKNGTTIILTTHYLEEAEMMADRIGVINKGKIILVEEKKTLMKKLGDKTLEITLDTPIQKIPEKLTQYNLSLTKDGEKITYRYKPGQTGITKLLANIKECGISLKDVETRETSLEEIFLSLIDNNNETKTI